MAILRSSFLDSSSVDLDLVDELHRRQASSIGSTLPCTTRAGDIYQHNTSYGLARHSLNQRADSTNKQRRRSDRSPRASFVCLLPRVLISEMPRQSRSPPWLLCHLVPCWCRECRAGFLHYSHQAAALNISTTSLLRSLTMSRDNQRHRR